MKHSIEVYAESIEKIFQEILDISDEIENELYFDGGWELDTVSRFQWIAMAEQRYAEEMGWA